MKKDTDRIKEKLDIVEFIKSYVDLKPAGKNFKGICPFHQETDASFIVSPERQTWHCFGCFPPGQKIKTPEGYHEIDKIKEDQIVYSGKGRPQKVIATHKRKYEGELVNISTRKLKNIVSLTADHKLNIVRPKTKHYRKTKQFYRQTRKYRKENNTSLSEAIERYSNIKEVSAGEVQKDDFVFYPINTRVSKQKTIDLRKYLTKKYTFGPHPPELKYKQEISDDLLKLIGYWIAEGSNHRAYIRFSLGNHEEDFADDIVLLIKKLFGLSASIHKRNGKRTGIEITACHAYLADIFEQMCGKGAENKHIPWELQEISPQKQMVLLDAMHRGDGYTYIANNSSKEHRAIATISPILKEQIVDILLRNGYFPSARTTKKRIDRNKVHHRESYTIVWSNEAVPQHNYIYRDGKNKKVKYWLLPVKEVSRKRYKGPVHNLTINEEHSYIAENFAVSNCGEGGDIITFVMMYENYEFSEALRFLADKAGIEIETRSGREQREFEILYDVNKIAENFFHKSLVENKKALLYLKKRGLKGSTIKEFKIGYSPGGDKLIVHLLDKGFKIQDIVNAGLAYKSKSNMYKDRFAGRIIFPLINRLDKTIGFGGRILEEGGDVAKYINTSQTPVYNKSKFLFGLNKAKKGIVDSKTVFLVEGYMDVIMAWQSGIKNAVAVSGTSLTTQHLSNLQRLADSVIVSFDNDSGGLRALERAIEIFGNFDFHVLAVDLGKYNDPAEACQEEPEFLKEAIKEAKPAMTRLFEASFSENLNMVEQKKRVRDMLQKIKKVKSSVDQDNWIRELSKHSGISEVSLWTEFENIEEVRKTQEETEKVENLSPKERVDLISRRLLVLAFTNDEFLRIVKDNKKLFSKEYQEIIDNPKSEEAGFIDMEASYEFGEINDNLIKQEFEELLRQLKIESLKKYQETLRKKMKNIADEQGEKEEVLKEFQKIALEIDELRQLNIFKNK